MENVILAVSPRKGDVVLLHSIKDFGGTLRRPESKVIGLTGLSNFSSPVEIDIDGELIFLQKNFLDSFFAFLPFITFVLSMLLP